MRKIVLTSILLIGTTLAMHTNAQAKASFGLKLSGDVTNLRFKDSKNKNNKFDLGGSLGGFMKIEFDKNFALQPELMMNYVEGKIKVGKENVKYRYSSVEVPIYMLGQFDVAKGRLFFGLGPIIGYGFDSDDGKVKIGNVDWDDWGDWFDSSKSNKVNWGLNHWYLGGGIIAGYEFRNRLSFHTGYQRTYDLRSKEKGRNRVETHTISLGVGYRF